MELMLLAFGMLGLLGHVAFCVAIFNRLHACSLPRRIGRWLEKLGIIAILAGAVVWPFWVLNPPGDTPDVAGLLAMSFPLAVYALLCAQLGCLAVVNWLFGCFRARQARQLIADEWTVVDVAQSTEAPLLGSARGHLFSRIPGNQMLMLHVHEKTLELSGLPVELDGFTIAHLSDLHFTGDLTRSYFEVVRDKTNELDVDLIAVTGDIIDSLACVDWIPGILGEMTSRLGGYFILGNHEKRLPDASYIRSQISAAGLSDLGNGVATVAWAGRQILLAGNERPWFDAVHSLLPQADLRVLLAHSPDQINWARQHAFDLMLAGHTHGGQIRIPLIGPVISPSNFGVKYASGTFSEPPTLMHVTRGISSQLPIRFNCPPELTKLVLRSSTQG